MANVMVVDDTVFMRNMLRGIIEEAGHTVVVECGTGVQAVDNYLAQQPDLVTMDITMPDMDGITAVQRILDHDPRARIIMCSAIGLHHMVLQAINAGAKDFIVKPFQKERVIESIQNVLQR